jgi:nitrous oxidase accessory protein
MGDRTIVENNRFENVLFGIDLKRAADCVIRGNVIGSMPLEEARRGDALRLFRSDRCLIESNTIEDGRDALLWYSNGVTVRKNVSRRNRYGFHMMYANDVTLEENVIEHNSVGIYLMYGQNFRVRGNRISRNRGPSGYGIGFKEVDRYEISHNVLSGNRVAIYLDGSPLRRRPGSATISENAIVCNDVGLSILPAVRGNRVERNNLIDNVEQLAIQGRGDAKGNDLTGNHWGDYAGYDADRDGAGDQPYQPRKLFESLTAREPKLRMMIYSPAHDAVEFVGRALPAIRPETKFADAAPRVRPIPLDLPALAADPNRRGAIGWAGAALLAGPALMGLSAFRSRVKEARR